MCSPNLWNIETTISIIIWYNNAHIWLAYLSFHCIYVIYLSERAYLSCLFFYNWYFSILFVNNLV